MAYIMKRQLSKATLSKYDMGKRSLVLNEGAGNKTVLNYSKI